MAVRSSVPKPSELPTLPRQHHVRDRTVHKFRVCTVFSNVFESRPFSVGLHLFI